MATITLYKDKINGIGETIDNIVKSTGNLNQTLGTIKKSLQGISGDNCNFKGMMDSISSSSKTEKEKSEYLVTLKAKLTAYTTIVVNSENKTSDEINKQKKCFYEKYVYLKPDNEKNQLELIEGKIDSVGDWCKKHWRAIVTVIIVAIAIGVLLIGVGPFLAEICMGAILGAILGGLIGGCVSAANGGSFWDGFEKGAFEGAIAGMLCGAIGGGILAAMKPAATVGASIIQHAFAYSIGGGLSSMGTAAMEYFIKNKTLNGCLGYVAEAGAIGAVLGGLFGALGGKLAFKKAPQEKIIPKVEEEPKPAKVELEYEEEMAVMRYTNDDYAMINLTLRKPNAIKDPFKKRYYEGQIDLIKSAIKKQNIQKDTIVYRGTIREAYGLRVDGNPNDLVGRVITEPGFSSTSPNPNVVFENFRQDSNLMMTIDLPKECEAMDISVNSWYMGEEEILLKPGQSFEITDAVYYENIDMLHIKVKAIP